MYLTPYGAVREVTGSMHLITAGEDRILLDCGMFQGRRKEAEIKNRLFQVDPRLITNVVLSHAHIDHCGRIPYLTRQNFFGRIITTRATQDACRYLLKDSAHIQESDADYLNYKSVRSYLFQQENSKRKKGLSKRKITEIRRQLKSDTHRINTETVNELAKRFNLVTVTPLYTMKDAEDSLNYFEGYPYGTTVTIGKNTNVTFYDAGHILGSAFCLLRITENGKTYRVLYSGDVGRFDKPILNDPTTHFPEEDHKIDLLILESTYGNRQHDAVKDFKQKLIDIIDETTKRGGSIIIPAFAFGRTQELIYVLHEIYNEGKTQRIPIYIDSPLASNMTKVFGEHPENYDNDARKKFLEKGENPFMFDRIHFTQTVEESMRLMTDPNPNIVIASSGMCEAGRILHHLRYKIHNEKNTILIVGYMAENTLGRRILTESEAYEKNNRKGEAPLLNFLNKSYPLRAHVKELGGFSGHADKFEIAKVLKDSKLDIKKIALVHGEEDQALAFQKFLEKNGYSVKVPYSGEIINID